jgi:hypothetical protein
LCQYSFTKKLQSQTVIREKLCKELSYKKSGIEYNADEIDNNYFYLKEVDGKESNGCVEAEGSKSGQNSDGADGEGEDVRDGGDGDGHAGVRQSLPHPFLDRTGLG